MRTGIKHLLGMSVTLLLLLTMIAWVDTWFGVSWTVTTRVNKYEIRIVAMRSLFGFAIVDIEEAGSSVRFLEVRRDAQSDPANGRWPRDTVVDFYFAAVTYDPDPHPWSNLLPAYVMYFRWWFVFVVLVVPVGFYLRFLYRRRRGSRKPTPEGSAP